MYMYYIKCLRLINTHKFKVSFLMPGESDPKEVSAFVICFKILTLPNCTIAVLEITFLAMEIVVSCSNAREPYFSRSNMEPTAVTPNPILTRSEGPLGCTIK